jgi:hypothetical protein
MKLDFGRFDAGKTSHDSGPDRLLKPGAIHSLQIVDVLGAPRFSPCRASLQLRQHLLAIVLDLWIVLIGVLHGEPFFDKAATFIFSVHLYVDCTESDIVH